MSDAAQGGESRRELLVVDAFIHLADTLVQDYDIIDLLHFLSERCVELTAVDEAAVMLAAPNGRLQAVAASSERSHLLELVELQNDDGPCLDAYRSGSAVSSADLSRSNDRWPTFSTEAVRAGFASVHSVPLRLRDTIIGALNLLRTSGGRLSDADARLVRALADIATIGVLQERTVTRTATEVSGLQKALTSRITIEQAKGIIAERVGIDVDEAFEDLRTFARRRGRRLTDVAADVVARRLDVTEVRSAR